MPILSAKAAFSAPCVDIIIPVSNPVSILMIINANLHLRLDRRISPDSLGCGKIYAVVTLEVIFGQGEQFMLRGKAVKADVSVKYQ